MTKNTILFFVGLWLAFFIGCATQDTMYSMDDRVTRLERDNADKDGGAQNVRTLSADLRAEMDQMKEEIQRLNGRLEETLFVLNQKIAALEDADRNRQQELGILTETASENRGRIEGVESYLNLEKSKAAAVDRPKETAKPAPKVEKKPADDRLYLSAKKDLDKGAYDAARKGFADLIGQFPNSTYADNAQFWIGESYFREKWYEKAILEYQKVIENYPKGNKVKASLLKQGTSFVNLGDAANARLILKELVRKYPESNEAEIARTKLKGLK